MERSVLLDCGATGTRRATDADPASRPLQPVFIRHRTSGEIDEANQVDVKSLRDPQTDAERVKKPEWCVPGLRIADAMLPAHRVLILALLALQAHHARLAFCDLHPHESPTDAPALQASAPTSDVSQLERPETTEDGTARATDPTTTFVRCPLDSCAVEFWKLTDPTCSWTCAPWTRPPELCALQILSSRLRLLTQALVNNSGDPRVRV